MGCVVEMSEWLGAGIEYRVSRAGDRCVVIMHGGHMHAGLELGEEVFNELGYTVIVPSRPGYGGSSSGRGRAEFVDGVAELVRQCGCSEVSAVVGISAGGPAAVELASRHPQLVRRLVLENAVSSLSWPDRLTRVAGRVVFAPAIQGAVWSATRMLLRRAPRVGLLALMSPLTSRPVRQVVSELEGSEKQKLTDLFLGMRSGRGFQLDLANVMQPSLLESTPQPALVIASANDASVGLEHAHDLVAHLPDARLVVNETSSHLMWFGPQSHTIGEELRAFFAEPTGQPGC